MEPVSTDELALNEKEKKAADAIIEVMHCIRDLAEEGCGVYNFTNEAVPAVHTLQQFVMQHWAHRVYPDYWANWFDMSLDRKRLDSLLDNLTAKVT